MATTTASALAGGLPQHGWTTAIADVRDGRLHYRGVDVSELVGRLSFDRVWGLLVCDDLRTSLPPAEEFPFPARTGDPRADLQASLAQLAPVWGLRPLHDTAAVVARDELARASAMALSFVARAARGPDLPTVPRREVERSDRVSERFLIRWRGEPDPQHVEALDAYFVAAAEDGFSPSAVAARVIAATGADVAAALSGAVGALSGPLHGGATTRALRLIEHAERSGDEVGYVRSRLDAGRAVPGFALRPPGGVDPRAAALRAICAGLRAPAYEAALALEAAAREAFAERCPGETVTTGFEFWGAVLLHAAQVPPALFTALYTCGRAAGWSAHILEQLRFGGLPVPGGVRYSGRPPRRLEDVDGWDPSAG